MRGRVIQTSTLAVTVMEFHGRFATEAVCLRYSAASRWPEGLSVRPAVAPRMRGRGRRFGGVRQV